MVQKWKETRMKWHQALGFGSENYRFHDHTKLAHYANAATDIEYKFPFGFKEVEGIHSRTDYRPETTPGIQREKDAVFRS